MSNWQGTATVYVTVLIETADRVIYRTWIGRDCPARAIHRKARKRYRSEFPGARVRFGRAVYTYSYGAH